MIDFLDPQTNSRLFVIAIAGLIVVLGVMLGRRVAIAISDNRLRYRVRKFVCIEFAHPREVVEPTGLLTLRPVNEKRKQEGFL